MERKILVATGNPGKLRELREMLDANAEFMSLSDFPDVVEVIEDGETFTENARKKALGYAKQTGLWTIADDSGLVVDALDGAPGVHSARFSGEKDKNRELLDHKNMARVLELMQDVPDDKRTARFVCHLCLASPDEVLIETEGILEGTITRRERGRNGFGYDPIVFVADFDKTVAELTAEQKNSISHRGRAIANLKPLLEKQLASS